MKKALLIILLFAVTGLMAAAQEQGDAQYGAPSDGGGSQGADPGVAHLSLVHGDVSMQRGDSGDWVATTLNTPIVRGDTIATADGSRAEIQLDYGDVLRLSGQTQAKLADLTRSHIQIQVSQGYANLSMFKGSEAEVEVDTPNVAVHPRGNGRYRIEVNSDSETNVIVREGEAEVSTPKGSTTVRAGEIISIRGTDDPEYKVSEAPGTDDWDQWNRNRDNTIHNAEGVRHTNPYYTGTQDLDAYGHWVYVPNYGEVWSPYDQPATWAPYQAGRWVWEPYYGWTWVSYEPWGWAPYHYGRWFFYDSSWYWWPGPITPFYRPIWAPAFVSFIGFGPHVGFGFGFGTIGWCPLGPFEVFHPWWGVGFNRFSVVDINVFERRGFGFHDRDGFRGRGFSNINLAFTNARVRAGITSVSAENFGRGAGGFQHGVDVGTLRGARLATGNLGVVPTRESLTPSNRGFSSAPSGIRSNGSTRFFSRTQATGSTPSFHEQTARMQAAIQAHGGAGQLSARMQNGSENGRFGRNDAATTGTRSGDRSGFHTFSGRDAGSTGRTGNEMRTDRPSNAGRTFGGNSGGSPSNNSGGNRDGFHTFSRDTQGGAVGNRGGGQSGFPQNGSIRNDRPSSSMGGGSKPQLGLNKPIVVPRSDTSSRGSYGGGGNYGGRNNGGGGYIDRGYSGGGRSGGGSYNGGGRSSGGYSGGRSGGGSYSNHSSGGGGGHSSGGGHSGGSSRGGGGRR